MAEPEDQAQLRTGSTATGSTANGSTGNADVVLRDAAIVPADAATGAGPRGRGSKRESDEIVAEIEQTRENLARTIDALADRVSPASNARRLKERAAAEFAKPEVQLAAAAIALTITGIVIARILSHRRGRRG
jgi:hypothetical protein